MVSMQEQELSVTVDIILLKYNTCTKCMCHYNSELSKLPDGFHNALFTNLLAAPLSILRDAMTKQIEKNNDNNSSLSLINPQTAPYKFPLPVNKTIHLNFVNRKQQVLTIFLASFWESVLIWFLNRCCVYLICPLKRKYLRSVEKPMSYSTLQEWRKSFRYD